MQDELVDKILEETDSMPDGEEFDHAVCYASLDQVLDILGQLTKLETRRVIDGFTGRMEWILERKLFISEIEGGTTLLWPPTGDTQLLQEISRLLVSPVKWVYVSEPWRSWAYLEYDRGVEVRRIVDPVKVWTTGMMNGDFLMGRGHREYATLAVFLSAIADRYTPLDRKWSFGTWDGEVRPDFLERTDLTVQWSLEVAFRSGKLHIMPHGKVPLNYSKIYPGPQTC
jgi:hypothetical protein